MEYQIENRPIAMGVKRRTALEFSWTQNLVAVHSFNIKGRRKKNSAEFGPMRSSIGNLTLDICHVTCPDKWHGEIKCIIETCSKSVFFNHPVLKRYPKFPTTTFLLDKNPYWSLDMSGHKLHTMLLLPVLEGGTYTPTGRTRPYKKTWQIFPDLENSFT